MQRSGLPADQPAIAREQAEILHDEIERLPRAFRLPVVLCYFEGLTLDEAAQRLSWPEPARSAAAWPGRSDKLRRGLTRRGIVLPAAALAAILDPRPASASVSSPLCDITTRAAMNFAAGQAAAGAASASAMALAQEVLRSMLLHNLKLTVFTLLFLGAVATGAGFVGQAPVASGGKARPTSDRHQAGRREPEAGPGPDVRRRPCARSVGQAGCRRGGDGLRDAQACRSCERPARMSGAIGQAQGRHRGPVPARRPAHLVIEPL